MEDKTLRADMKLHLAEKLQDQPEESSGKGKKGDTPGALTLDMRETEVAEVDKNLADIKALNTNFDHLSSTPQTSIHHGRQHRLPSDHHTCAIVCVC